MAAKQGFLMYNSKGDAIGTKVSVRYRRSGRLSEVVVKRGSTVVWCPLYDTQRRANVPCVLVRPCARGVSELHERSRVIDNSYDMKQNKM